MLDQTLADPRVRFFGNVTFGVDLHHHDLKRLHDQVVYAVGAQADRRMSIPGEDLPNSLAALVFVGWYNGHPDYRDLEVDLDGERAVVVGNGNVAMDVTRMLVRSHDELARTDTADHAVEALAASRIREGEFEVIEAGLVLRSIGYRTVPIEGVPFDPATATVNNIAGQITHPNSGEVTPPTRSPSAPPRAAPGSRCARSPRSPR